MLLYVLAQSSCERIRDLIKSMTIKYIPAIPNRKPDFGAPNCPVRAVRYYHRYMTEHPELRKGRHCLFIPIKDTNLAAISRWICTTLVDRFSCLPSEQQVYPRKGQSSCGPCRGTSLQLFNKVDLQAVMKAGRWSSGGTFTSFYLRELYPQADCIWKTGPVVSYLLSLTRNN